MTNIGKSSMTGLALILSEKYIGGQDLSLDKNTISRFVESTASDYLSDWVINNNYITSLKMSNLNSQLMTNSVLSGFIYLLLDYFAKMDNGTSLYKFLYQVGSSAVANFGYYPIINSVKTV